MHETAVIDDNVQIGKDSKIWHFSHILKDTKLGERCNVGQNVVLGPEVCVGDGCKIQNNVSLFKGITLEENVFCGPSMVFTNVFNPRAHIRKMDAVRPTLVKTGATLGANSTIICGVTIGKYALIGAGAVVTKDVPDHALVVGNPAKQSGWMCECGEKLNGQLVCETCSKEFQWLEQKQEKGNIPFVDLAAQQKRILPQIEKQIQTVLQHGRYVMGPEVKELERELEVFSGAKHVISCASGTDALIMALMALGVGPGDAVFTTPFTFIATAEAVRLVGATPIFVDIDSATFNISVGKLQQAILDIKKSGQDIKPKAIIPVDLFGLPADYDEIDRIAQEHKLYVVEDAAQSFGGEYKGKVAGSLGHVGCTSFFPAKPLGCYGDGGAIFTDSDDLADTLDSIRVHGKGTDKYDNIRMGVNGRLDTLQAAILLPKLEIFPDELLKRQKVARRYTELLSESSLSLPQVASGYKSAWAQYSVMARESDERDVITARLKDKGIPFAIYYPIPLHLQTVYRDLGYRTGDFPVCEECSTTIFSLPMHPYLTKKDQESIAQVL
ncbi:MAG: aminotransferase class I/II-fold pyridoxal phosphate-dependent enzyme, partial [Desulfobulbaceae bacterium]|nr:aminotransferase class I/II-fold pyridoxal phosphate-dependent enzyme [Desulfobulbaceae bacterium]